MFYSRRKSGDTGVCYGRYPRHVSRDLERSCSILWRNVLGLWTILLDRALGDAGSIGHLGSGQFATNELFELARADDDFTQQFLRQRNISNIRHM